MKTESIKKYNFLYKTTNLLNGKFYIGMHITDNLMDGYLGSGKILRRSIRKYGKENFKCEILAFYVNQELLAEAEKSLVTLEILNDNMCMNLMTGGFGGRVASDEHYKKVGFISGKIHAEKLKTDKEYSKWHSQISSERLKKTHSNGKINYNTFEGKFHSEETKELISSKKQNTGRGEKNSQFGTCWITKDETNKKIKLFELESFLSNGWSKGRI
jgi:group I intron endonuclease